MRFVLVVGAAAGLLSAGLVFAQSGADVLKAKGCVNCHEMDKKKVGPSLKDVAAKHKGKANASAMLVGKLKDGKGHPKAAGTDAEIKAAVDYVLSVK
jgi:cytochrome c